MANKVVISVVSLVLVVGAVLGVVAIVTKGGDSNGKGGDSGSKTTASNKAVDTICKPTEYKDACLKVMNDMAKNSTATHKDYLMAAFYSTMDELNKALEKASSVKNGLDAKKDSTSHANLESCEKMLGYATDELNQVLKVISESEPIDISEEIDPVLEWLTAVRAYQTTCVEEIDDEKLKKEMQQALDAANQLTFNAQKIVFHVVDILKNVGVDVSDLEIPLTGHRRLLEEELQEIKDEGFPSWVSDADRRLLGGKGKGKKGKKQGKGQGLFKTPPPPPVAPGTRPNAVVAQDGSGQFKSIKAALAAYPPNHQGRYIIYVKAGIYNEGPIVVEKNMNNVFMYGDGKWRTTITGDLNYAIKHIGTSNTATFVALGERFMAKSITFRNTIGPAGHQAVAFRSQSPHTVVMDCSIEGYQDTLYYHAHDQFYKNCEISGTVDFIFGSGRAYIQDSDIYVRKPDPNQANMVTADGRIKYEEAGGVVLHNCRILPAPEYRAVQAQIPTYLGRPWKPAATSIILQCDLYDMIRPVGWTQWESPEGKNNHMTCTFREYSNRGPGSFTGGRVKWPSYKTIFDRNEAAGFSAGRFIDGGAWLPLYGIPANLGLY